MIVDSEKLVSNENPAGFLCGAFDEGIDEKTVSACATRKLGSPSSSGSTIEVGSPTQLSAHQAQPVSSPRYTMSTRVVQDHTHADQLRWLASETSRYTTPLDVEKRLLPLLPLVGLVRVVRDAARKRVEAAAEDPS